MAEDIWQKIKLSIWLCAGVMLGSLIPFIALYKLGVSFEVQPQTTLVRHSRSVILDPPDNHNSAKITDAKFPYTLMWKTNQDKTFQHPGRRSSGKFDHLKSLPNLEFTKNLFIGVLSTESRVTDMSSAAWVTWAGNSENEVRFLYKATPRLSDELYSSNTETSKDFMLMKFSFEITPRFVITRF
jgi:hypothetical protein